MLYLFHHVFTIAAPFNNELSELLFSEVVECMSVKGATVQLFYWRLMLEEGLLALVTNLLLRGESASEVRKKIRGILGKTLFDLLRTALLVVLRSTNLINDVFFNVIIVIIVCSLKAFFDTRGLLERGF